MTTVTPYPRYSSYLHTSASELIKKNHEFLATVFPVVPPQQTQISALFITSSAGKYTLLLGDAIAFLPFNHSCDTLREICPVIIDCVARGCSLGLLRAVRDCGETIPGSPLLVALEIDIFSRGCFSIFTSACFSNYPSAPNHFHHDPQGALIQAIRSPGTETFVGKYRVKRVGNSWQPPAGSAGWQGLAFEQSDRIIRTWLHEANPQALQSARDEVQRLITKTQRAQDRKTADIAREASGAQYVGEREEQLDRELAEITQTLQDLNNRHRYLTSQTVNSAAHTTLQCAITMEIDLQDKIQLLERFVCQRIVTTIDEAMDQLEWGDLEIASEAIENFIQEKFRELEARIPALAALSAQPAPERNTSLGSRPALRVPLPRLLVRNRTTLNDWEYFRDIVMQRKRAEIRQTRQQFYLQEGGPQNEAELERKWKQKLKDNLNWVTRNLRVTEEELKNMDQYRLANVDIRIFDNHRVRMVDILRRGNQLPYALGLKLEQQYAQRDFLREPVRHRRCVHLVKRAVQDGYIYFGVSPVPTNPTERPDPNSDLNEVHIRVSNPPNPF